MPFVFRGGLTPDQLGDQVRHDGHDDREHPQQRQCPDLDQDERNDPAVDMRRGDARRGHAAQVEEREAEGRCQERGLQVHRNHDRHPLRIESAAVDHRPDDRDHDVDDLEEVEHEAQHKEHQHHDQEDRQLVVEAFQPLLDVVFATKGDHHKVQQLRSDQDGKYHRGHLGRLADHGA